ncbi:MAG: leucyl aminopeptidase [Thermoplasmata archaeon]|nr:leucyl aminopeptidase [Thermoplasmata archaeon]
MRFALDRREATQGTVDAIAVGLAERAEKEDAFPRALAREDQAYGKFLSGAWERREIRGKRKEVTVFHRADGKGRLLVVGLGPRTLVDTETLRNAAAEVVRALKGRGARTLGFKLASFANERIPAETAVRALVDGAALGGYEFLRYKSSHEGKIEETTVFLGEEAAREEAPLRKALEQEEALVETVLWTRDIANVPADTATPEWLAEQARGLAKEFGVKVTVFDEKKLAEMNCGGILGVGGGSVHPPRLIVLEYGGGARSGKTVAVVGKGITFDSGGISLKPAPGMSTMKFDKSGACAVLGVVRAAAVLKVPPRVIGVMACAENLPGPSAYRPGDVLRTHGGKTIEVLNTDAEGRVVLSDALGYVVEKYHPDQVVDMATLTGACVVALGPDIAGLVSNDEVLAQSLLDASRQTGETVWRMPLTDTHREMVKSDVGDVRNSTELKEGGMLTAAAFLENFVGKTAWAHLDIAGPAICDGPTARYVPSYFNHGATAFGVRLVARYLMTTPR